jgi:hypothetical protein
LFPCMPTRCGSAADSKPAALANATDASQPGCVEMYSIPAGRLGLSDWPAAPSDERRRCGAFRRVGVPDRGCCNNLSGSDWTAGVGLCADGVLPLWLPDGSDSWVSADVTKRPFRSAGLVCCCAGTDRIGLRSVNVAVHHPAGCGSVFGPVTLMIRTSVRSRMCLPGVPWMQEVACNHFPSTG